MDSLSEARSDSRAQAGKEVEADASADAEPGSESGAVTRRAQLGPVVATLRLQPAEPRIGDALSLQITVVAPAEVEVLMPEFGQSLDRFAILDFAPSQRVDSQGRIVRQQIYRLQTLRSGAHAIPPIIIEFVDRRPGQREAPEGEDAYELLTERLDFEVRSVKPADAGDGLEPALGPLPPLEAPSVAAATRWLWALPVLGVALLVGLLVLRAWRARGRRRSPYQIASARLAALKARPLPDSAAEMDRFFVELSDLVRRYLEGRFHLHAPELTSEEFIDVASGSPDLSDTHKHFLNEFLQIADRVKFARHLPAGQQVASLLSSVDNFVEQTRDEQVQHA
ncbi:MAG: hypothetical protein KDK91_03620 [Gammaproteobacteria bacterium]|nr:hypothetical protein [Gammaproteobacteria bacterium]